MCPAPGGCKLGRVPVSDPLDVREGEIMAHDVVKGPGAGSVTVHTSGRSHTGRGTAGARLAVVLMILTGALWAWQGFVGIIKGSFYIQPAHYLITTSMFTWGWTHLILGILVWVAAYGVFAGFLWARVAGIVLACVSVLVNFMFIPIYPLWSLVIIALDAWVIYALVVYRPEPA